MSCAGSACSAQRLFDLTCGTDFWGVAYRSHPFTIKKQGVDDAHDCVPHAGGGSRKAMLMMGAVGKAATFPDDVHDVCPVAVVGQVRLQV